MDAKTYEYMKNRVEKFKAMQKTIETLEDTKRAIRLNRVSTIYNGCTYKEIPECASKTVTDAIINAIDDSMEKVRKEMEEI